MALLALACAVLQAVSGDAQLVLHLTPLFLIGGLLLAGRYVGEERSSPAGAPPSPRAPGVPCAPAGGRAPSEPSRRCSSARRASSAARPRRSPPPDAPHGTPRVAGGTRRRSAVPCARARRRGRPPRRDRTGSPPARRAGSRHALPPPDDLAKEPSHAAPYLRRRARRAPHGGAAAYAHNASPDYLTQVNAVTPATKGVTVTVINRSDRLLLHNTSNANVLIDGYKGEPYAPREGRRHRRGQHGLARVLPQRGPLRADEGARERRRARGAPLVEGLWSKTGRSRWHDHRMHWMSQQPGRRRCQGVKEKTKIFDWTVPLKAARPARRHQGARCSGTPQVRERPARHGHHLLVGPRHPRVHRRRRPPAPHAAAPASAPRPRRRRGEARRLRDRVRCSPSRCIRGAGGERARHCCRRRRRSAARR